MQTNAGKMPTQVPSSEWSQLSGLQKRRRFFVVVNAHHPDLLWTSTDGQVLELTPTGSRRVTKDRFHALANDAFVLKVEKEDNWTLKPLATRWLDETNSLDLEAPENTTELNAVPSFAEFPWMPVRAREEFSRVPQVSQLDSARVVPS